MRQARVGKVSRGFMVAATVALIATPASFMGYKLWVAQNRSVEERGKAVRVLDAFPLHDENEQYFERMLDAAHPVAFRAGYETGGLFSMARFDETAYNRALAEEVLRLMRAQEAERAAELAQMLEDHFQRHPALFN